MMNLKFKHIDKIVGLFILTAIFLFIFILLLIIFNQKYFIKKYTYYTQFNDAEGLKVNQDIVFKGFKIGKISKITLSDTNFIDVELYIYEDYIKKIKENSVINKTSNPLTGSTIVFIPNNQNDRIADEYSFIPSLDSKAGEFLLTLGEVERKSDAISNIINNVDSLLKSLNSDHNAEDNSISRILVNAADIVESVKSELKSIDIIVGNLKLLSNNMKTPDGLVQRMLDPDGTIMFNSIRNSLNNLDVMMEELASFSKFINKQSNQIETILIDGKTTIKDAKAILEGIKNNPLIKSSIETENDQQNINDTIRDRDF